MQGRKIDHTKAKRRKDGRTPTADLLAWSNNAYSLRKIAKRQYLGVRLQIDANSIKRLKTACKKCGITASDLARQAVRIHASIFLEKGGKAKANKLMARLFARNRANRGRRTNSAIDRWAEERIEAGKPWQKKGLNLRLSAYDLADIATEQDIRRTSNQAGLSFSCAFRFMLWQALRIIENGIRDREYRALTDINAGWPKKPRQNRNRLYTEAKRRLAEKGYKTSL